MSSMLPSTVVRELTSSFGSLETGDQTKRQIRGCLQQGRKIAQVIGADAENRIGHGSIGRVPENLVRTELRDLHRREPELAVVRANGVFVTDPKHHQPGDIPHQRGQLFDTLPAKRATLQLAAAVVDALGNGDHARMQEPQFLQHQQGKVFPSVVLRITSAFSIFSQCTAILLAAKLVARYFEMRFCQGRITGRIHRSSPGAASAKEASQPASTKESYP